MPSSTTAKLTQQEKRDVQRLLLAIDTNTLDEYFANFTDAQIDTLCEAVKIRTDAPRQTKTKRLERKIKANEQNILTIAEIGVHRYLSAVMSLGTLWLGSAGLAGYKSIRALKHARENNLKVDLSSHAGAGMMVMMGVLYSPFFGLFARASYKKQRTLTRKYRQWKKEKRSITVKTLGTALKKM